VLNSRNRELFINNLNVRLCPAAKKACTRRSISLAKGEIFSERQMVEYNIGAKLKKLRMARKLTLQSVAKQVGFSASRISQIENNNISPPIPTLAKMAKFFSVEMSSFFTDDNEKPKYEIIRKDDRKMVPRAISREGTVHGYYYETFSFKKKDRKIEPFLITLYEAKQDSNTYSNEGESFLYVIDGTFHLQIDERKISLQKGDGIYFDASLEHRFRSIEGKKATLLEVCCRG
jgi:transcriptional regulator with XRE-family HTH domain